MKSLMFASKFPATDDVARNVTLLPKLLICTHKHTYTHIIIVIIIIIIKNPLFNERADKMQADAKTYIFRRM